MKVSKTRGLQAVTFFRPRNSDAIFNLCSERGVADVQLFDFRDVTDTAIFNFCFDGNHADSAKRLHVDVFRALDHNFFHTLVKARMFFG